MAFIQLAAGLRREKLFLNISVNSRIMSNNKIFCCWTVVTVPWILHVHIRAYGFEDVYNCRFVYLTQLLMW